MSKSYRKPYAPVTGVRSAAEDKKVARRSWRRVQNLELRTFKGDWDEFLIPARYEASDNDVWGWGRDGKQWLHFAPALNWDIYKWTAYSCQTEEELIEEEIESFARDVEYYERLKRK